MFEGEPPILQRVILRPAKSGAKNGEALTRQGLRSNLARHEETDGSKTAKDAKERRAPVPVLKLPSRQTLFPTPKPTTGLSKTIPKFPTLAFTAL